VVCAVCAVSAVIDWVTHWLARRSAMRCSGSHGRQNFRKMIVFGMCVLLLCFVMRYCLHQLRTTGTVIIIVFKIYVFAFML
jgi:hypothetical protein